jgi:hypothetical protein
VECVQQPDCGGEEGEVRGGMKGGWLRERERKSLLEEREEIDEEVRRGEDLEEE